MNRYDTLKDEDVNSSSDADTEGLLGSENTAQRFAPRNLWGKIHIGLLYLLCFILSIITTVELSRKPKDVSLGKIFTPAADVIKYEQREFTWNFWDKGPYMGFPTDEKDKMWSDLYNFGTSGIPNAQAERLLYDTVPVPGSDSESLVMLDVWHQLHCLNAVRRAIFPERWPEIWTYKEDGSIDYDTVEMKHIGRLTLSLFKHND